MLGKLSQGSSTGIFKGPEAVRTYFLELFGPSPMVFQIL
jgi:hypothetical protein